MKILIKNLINTYNYGSMMMGENLITYFNKYSTFTIKYYIEDASRDNINRLKKATEYENIYEAQIPKYKTSNNKIVRLLTRGFREKRIIKEYEKLYDFIIILGGDDYSEEYYDLKNEGKYIIHLLKNLDKTNKKIPVYMLSQTIGPYSGERKKLAAKIFNNIHVYTRDDKNYNYLTKELGCKNIKRMYDFAFLDLHLQENNSDILNKYDLVSEEYIVFVGTGLMHHYTDNKNDMIKQTNILIDKLLKKYRNKKIVWLSHVIGDHSPDDKMLKELEIASNKKERVVIINDELLPVDARFIIGNAYMLITCRMHAAVSSLQMGKAPICLSYSVKFSGVVGQEFDLSKYILELKSNSVWANDDVSQKIMDLTDSFDEEKDILNKNIKAKMCSIKETNEKIIKKLVHELENKHD